MNDLDEPEAVASVRSPFVLAATALSAVLLAGMLVAVLLSAQSRGNRRSQDSTTGSAVLSLHVRPDVAVYIVGSRDEGLRLAQALSDWARSQPASLRVDERPVVVVQTAEDARSGRLFDFSFILQESGGSRVSFVDLRRVP
jgi:hypothetical protein